MVAEVSLKFSQERSTGPYSESDECRGKF